MPITVVCVPLTRRNYFITIIAITDRAEFCYCGSPHPPSQTQPALLSVFLQTFRLPPFLQGSSCTVLSTSGERECRLVQTAFPQLDTTATSILLMRSCCHTTTQSIIRKPGLKLATLRYPLKQIRPPLDSSAFLLHSQLFLPSSYCTVFWGFFPCLSAVFCTYY